MAAARVPEGDDARVGRVPHDLLTLMHLHLTENADERKWARILRQNHIDQAGKPPLRRLVDGKTLVA